MMLTEPYLVRALIAGLLVAVTAAPLGCFVVWKRMAYFGDALSHSALLGIAMGLALQIPLHIAIVMVCAVFAVVMFGLQHRKSISNDTLLGILAHSMLAFGLVGIALMPGVRVNFHSVLFGDILSVKRDDLFWVAGGAIVVMGVLWMNWQKLLLATLSEDLAKAEGYHTGRLQALLLFALTITVALAIQIVGVLLVTAMLIIPAATARIFSRNPEFMAAMAALIGMISVGGGLYASLIVDVPTGPSIVAMLVSLFFVTSLAGYVRKS